MCFNTVYLGMLVNSTIKWKGKYDDRVLFVLDAQRQTTVHTNTSWSSAML